MIRAGVGGWTFEPWRGTFFPPGLTQSRELEYAASKLTTIEVNGTFYSTMSPATFAKWHTETPDDFVFALKAPRYAVNRRELAGAGDSIDRFMCSGIDALGDKLGPILWQFAGTKRFDAEDFAKFIALLPPRVGDRPLRHVLEPRHDSFGDPAFIAMARDAVAAIVFADDDVYPNLHADTADFTYARMQRGMDHEPLCYPDAAIDGIADAARDWGSGGRDAFVYFINGGKVNAPAGAMALIERLGHGDPDNSPSSPR